MSISAETILPISVVTLLALCIAIVLAYALVDIFPQWLENHGRKGGPEPNTWNRKYGIHTIEPGDNKENKVTVKFESHKIDSKTKQQIIDQDNRQILRAKAIIYYTIILYAAAFITLSQPMPQHIRLIVSISLLVSLVMLHGLMIARFKRNFNHCWQHCEIKSNGSGVTISGPYIGWKVHKRTQRKAMITLGNYCCVFQSPYTAMILITGIFSAIVAFLERGLVQDWGTTLRYQGIMLASIMLFFVVMRYVAVENTVNHLQDKVGDDIEAVRNSAAP